jgi:hypothetical protein
MDIGVGRFRAIKDTGLDLEDTISYLGSDSLGGW